MRNMSCRSISSYMGNSRSSSRTKCWNSGWIFTHVFFGSDYPIWCPRKELAKARALHLDPGFLEDILFNNFA